MKKIIGFILMSMLVLAGYAQDAKISGSAILASVDGEVITLGDVLRESSSSENSQYLL